MNKILTLILCCFSLSGAAQNNLKTLKANIENRLKGIDGNFAVAFKDLQTGKTLYINEKENFHAASTMKTPVMIELFKQVNQQKINLEDSVLIKNEFKSIIDGSLYSLDIDVDSDDIIYKNIGKKMKIYDLCYLMITVSSNFATNILIEKVGAENVMTTMKQLGANDIRVLRGVEDSKAFQAGKNNTTNAFDLALIFEKIAKKQIENKATCEAMTKILLDQKFNEIIPAQLPKDVKVAHKTGSITGVQHDSGFVILPNDKKYILVLLSKNLKNTEAAVAAMADISKMIYGFVNDKK